MMERAEELLGRIADASERTAKAQEDLITLATEERDSVSDTAFPPHCPQCGMFDPPVVNKGGNGKMSEFVLVAKCMNCNGEFLGDVQGWLCFKTVEELKAHQEGGHEGT